MFLLSLGLYQDELIVRGRRRQVELWRWWPKWRHEELAASERGGGEGGINEDCVEFCLKLELKLDCRMLGAL